MIAGLLYDVLRSQDCRGANCYTTHLFIGSRSSLVRLLRTTSPTHNLVLSFSEVSNYAPINIICGIKIQYMATALSKTINNVIFLDLNYLYSFLHATS